MRLSFSLLHYEVHRVWLLIDEVLGSERSKALHSIFNIFNKYQIILHTENSNRLRGYDHKRAL